MFDFALERTCPDQAKAVTIVRSGRVRIEGHLLASGLLDRVVDAIVDGGGSFRILRFQLGKQRQSPSDAEVQVSAPDQTVLDRIMARLIELGAVTAAQVEPNAELQEITQAGVAPKDSMPQRFTQRRSASTPTGVESRPSVWTA